MPLDSAHAKVIAAAPRITPEDHDRLIHLLAEGKKPPELALQFGKAVGTIYNFQTRWKAEIADLRRSRTVQFDDIAGTRKQARLDDYWGQRTAYMMLFRKHLESCFATNPMTGEKEFIEQLVDARKLKIYSDQIYKFNKLLAVETGQLVQLDDRWTEHVLGLKSSGEGIDYAKIAQRKRERQQQEDADRKWMAENAEAVAEDEVNRLLNLARIHRQPPPSFRRLADAAHEALEDIDDDAVHARVDRWLDGRFPGGVVEVQLEQRVSDVAVTGPDAVDHGQVAARLAAGVDEHEDQTDDREPDVDSIIRLMPPQRPVEEAELEPVEEAEPEPELDEHAELRAAFVSSLTDVDEVGHDELMQASKPMTWSFLLSWAS
jgi:hypothetical protein